MQVSVNVYVFLYLLTHDRMMICSGSFFCENPVCVKFQPPPDPEYKIADEINRWMDGAITVNSISATINWR